MLRALTRDWTRIRNEVDRLVYFVQVNDFTLCNVFREGNHWQWLVVAIPTEPHSEQPVIVKHGSGQTKNECQWQAERYLPPASQQELGF
jgi:hypothetical protein